MRGFRRVMVLVVLVAIVLVSIPVFMFTIFVVFVLLAVVFFGHRFCTSVRVSGRQYRNYIHCIP